MTEYLVFIHKIGENSTGMYEYDVIFTTEPIFEVCGQNWHQSPAEGAPKAPLGDMSSMYRLETEVELELVIDSLTFSMKDAIDKVVALAWESEKDESYDASRFHMHFGNSLKEITNKTFERDMKFNKIK